MGLLGHGKKMKIKEFKAENKRCSKKVVSKIFIDRSIKKILGVEPGGRR